MGPRKGSSLKKVLAEILDGKDKEARLSEGGKKNPRGLMPGS